jgi:hypothetical protein
MRTITLFLLVGTLAGCASTNLTSVQTAANVHPSGTTYSLPTARVTAQLIYQPQRGFALRVALPPFIPDPTSGFYSIGYRGSAVEADKVQVEVEDGLLKSVNIASESKLLDAVQGGGESIGAIAAVLETSVTSDQADTPITVRFDPTVATDVATAGQDLTKALHAYAKEQLALDALRDKPKASETVAVAENALRAHLLTSALNATISLEGAFPAIVSGQGDCTQGICYRPLRSGQLNIKVNGASFTQLGMNIPNGSPAVAFPLSRAGASNSGQILGLDHGVLTSSTITKDAEASTIVRIPGTLIGGIIKGLTDTLTAKKGELGASTDVINAQAGVADARAKLIDSQTALAAKRKGAASLEASIDDAASGDLWLPGLSYLRTTSDTASTKPKVGQDALQPGQQGAGAGAGQAPAGQQAAGQVPAAQPGAGGKDKAGQGQPTGTTGGSTGQPGH